MSHCPGTGCRLLVGLVLCMVPVLSCAEGDKSLVRSPDGTLVAVVRELHRAGVDRVGESAIEIRKSDGDVLQRQAYASFDGEHGAVAAQIQWSSDSRYLVWITQSSGGHQPWNSPTSVWSRAENAVYSIDTCLAPVAEPSFELKPVDVITVSLNTRTADGVIAGPLPVTFRLSDLAKACKGR